MRIRWRNLELPMRVECDKETLTETYGKFTAEPFEHGYGITIGNSLRRVLLASIEGTAVTSVKIEGAQHEFTNLSGVYEDVTDIILNLKKLRLRIHVNHPVKLYIDVCKKGDVTAADIRPSHEFEIISNDLLIARLTEEVHFKLEAEARCGRGYVTAEENLKEPQEVGLIPIDSFFSPVRKVKYATENTRVGKMTNYDRLIMEIWTDGTISPEMALVEAAKILRKHLNPFVQYFELGKELEKEKAKEEEPLQESDQNLQELQSKLDMPIENLDLGVRASNCLESVEIKTIRDLVTRTETDLLRIKNFGKTSLKEIKDRLQKIGLDLGMDMQKFGIE